MSNLLSRTARTLHLGTSATLFAAAGLQALSFVLLARGLGVVAFGALMLATAVTQLAVEAVSLGSGEAMIRSVARDASEHGAALGHALLMTLATVVPLGLGAVVAAHWIVPGPTTLALAIFVCGELIGGRLGLLGEHAFMANSQIAGANVLRVVLAFSRLVAVAVAIYAMQLRSLDVWIIVQGLTSLVAGAGCLLYAVRRLGPPRFQFRRADVPFGAQIAALHISRAVQFSADRLVLGMVGSPAIVGVYAAAMRVAQLATLPVQAVMRNLFARFFSVGERGIGATRRFALANLKPILFIGTLAGGLILIGADIIVVLLGREFEDSAGILRGLCLLPLTQGLRLLLGDVLSGADRQPFRTAMELTAGAVFVVTLAVLAAAFGPWGAVASVYAYQIVVIGACAAAIWKLEKREAKGA